MEKVYLEVTAKHDIEGRVTPLAIKWPNGRLFEIDKVIDARKAAALKAGGSGMRYTCKISGKEVLLFCSEGKWFLDM